MSKPALDVLLPRIRRELLSILFRDPARWWYLSELAEAMETSPSSLQRELAALGEGGIIERSEEGRRTYYRANERAAIFPELRGLIEKTNGVPQLISEALSPIAETIDRALIYGSIASGEAHAESDVDLLVVSDQLPLERLYEQLQGVEAKLKRTINPTLYTTAEFEGKIAATNPFLKKVFERPHIILLEPSDGE